MKQYNREVTVNNDMAKELKFDCDFKVKAGEDRTIEGFASTENVDRDGEIVSGEAVAASFNEFLENGVLLFGHDRNQVIGKVLAGAPTPGGFMIRAQLAKNVKKADEAWALIEQGMLKAFSIGFRALDFDFKDDGTPVITKIELVEVSIVPIPSNRQSLFQVAKSYMGDIGHSINSKKPTDFSNRFEGFLEDYKYFLEMKSKGSLNKKLEIKIDGLLKSYDDLSVIEMAKDLTLALSEIEVLEAQLKNAQLTIQLLED